MFYQLFPPIFYLLLLIGSWFALLDGFSLDKLLGLIVCLGLFVYFARSSWVSIRHKDHPTFLFVDKKKGKLQLAAISQSSFGLPLERKDRKNKVWQLVVLDLSMIPSKGRGEPKSLFPNEDSFYRLPLTFNAAGTTQVPFYTVKGEKVKWVFGDIESPSEMLYSLDVVFQLVDRDKPRDPYQFSTHEYYVFIYPPTQFALCRVLAGIMTSSSMGSYVPKIILRDDGQGLL